MATPTLAITGDFGMSRTSAVEVGAAARARSEDITIANLAAAAVGARARAGHEPAADHGGVGRGDVHGEARPHAAGFVKPIMSRYPGRLRETPTIRGSRCRSA